MKTKEEKIEAIEKAIDALINLCEIEEINAHELVHSEKSTVSKLRSYIFNLENE